MAQKQKKNNILKNDDEDDDDTYNCASVIFHDETVIYKYAIIYLHQVLIDNIYQCER